MLAIAWPHDLVPATLAFLAPAQDGPEHQAWRDLFAHARTQAHGTAHVLRQTWSLPAPTRQAAFERLLTRCASLPPPERATLRRQAHRIVRADGRLALVEIWHCLLLDHVLESRHESVLRETHCLSLQQCAPAIACLTDLLAAQRFPGHAELAAVQSTWRTEMAAALELEHLPAPGAALDWPAISAAMRQLASLSWMLRPQPMKAWCAMALAGEPPAPQALVDGLRTVCILIDTPMPPELQAAYPDRKSMDVAT
jgi:hypothetical protein